MKNKLTKRDKVTLWISIPFVLYALHILLGFWFGWAEYTGVEQWIIFPAVALGYTWFIAQRYGPLWALPALLFCMLIEIFSIRNDVDISILWWWMGGPTLWGPIIGYGIGSLIFVSKNPFSARKGREEADT